MQRWVQMQWDRLLVEMRECSGWPVEMVIGLMKKNAGALVEDGRGNGMEREARPPVVCGVENLLERGGGAV